uniref:Tachyzoite surface protein n=1 Tax=Neospora caninum TaxID=29176 RepID=Q58L79_NEOCA|nr:tachyzoite surface protein [Neospora caninum]
MATHACVVRRKADAACFAKLSASQSCLTAKSVNRSVSVFALLFGVVLAVGVSGAPFKSENEKFTCLPKQGNADQWVALVYDSQHSITFACDGGTPLPSKLLSEDDGLIVCNESDGEDECEKNAAPLSTFLPGAKKEWVTGTLQQGIKITIPDEHYPATSKAFRVGCKAGKNVCLLNVYVQSRESEVIGQVAHCAYSSNVRLRPITVNPENNGVTLICGPDGKAFPDDYMNHHCTELDECKERPYSAVFPGFSSSFWTGEASGVAGATLTIPKDQFPSTAQTIYLGCTGHPDDKQVTCVVPVNIEEVAKPAGAGSNPGGGSQPDQSSEKRDGEQVNKGEPPTGGSGGATTGKQNASQNAKDKGETGGENGDSPVLRGDACDELPSYVALSAASLTATAIFAY